jgi:hypothetical protein
MEKDFVDQLLKLARQAAPEIESAVSAVKDPELRAAMAGAVMQRILAEAGRATSPRTRATLNGDSEQQTRGGTQARILDLRSDKFFADPRRLEEVLEELRVRGYHHNKSDVRMSLLRLARKKSLRRIPLGEGRQRTYLYVNP